MMRGTTAINSAMELVWAPALNKARLQGRIAPGLSNEYILEWVRHVHSAIRLRNDLKESQRRQMFQDFLVPSILRGAAAAQRPETFESSPPQAAPPSGPDRARRRAEA